MNRIVDILALAITLSACTRQGEVAKPSVSGIVNYTFQAEPEGIIPKMHNWELMLTEADSQNVSWTIVQVTRSLADTPSSDQVVAKVLIGPEMIVPNQAGCIHFTLHACNKEPTPNLGAPGNIGQPVSFSGRGTGMGASSWIVLPGSGIREVIPSETGTPLVDGSLRIIRFIAVNADGERFQSDVMLRRE